MAKQVRIPEHLYAEIEAVADSERRSVTNMVRLLLERGLSQGVLLDGPPKNSPAVREPREGIEVPADGKMRALPPSRNDDHFKPDFK